MFVGYEIKTNQNQAKPITLTKDIKLSQAVLDPTSKNNKKDPVCLVVEQNKKQFIVAVLDPNQAWQAQLDLMFAAGSQLKFFLRGSGTVHITGYECDDNFDDMSYSITSDEDVDEEEEEEEEPEVQKSKKRRLSAIESKSPKTNGAKGSAKKAKKIVSKAGDEQDDDDDDDDDFQVESSDDDNAQSGESDDDMDDIDDESMDDEDNFFDSDEDISDLDEKTSSSESEE